MMSSELLAIRLSNQGLTGPGFARSEEAVGWLGAVQSQDYLAATWALGLRVPGASEASIEQAFNEGRFLRTHVLRPTWHFVLPADIRWMLKLTAPRVRAVMAYNNRNLGLDEAVFKRSRAAFIKTLRGGRQSNRVGLAAALERAGIDTSGLRFNHLTMRAELDGLLCSGARQGRQFTWALLDERVPAVPDISRDEALPRLARRYFTSHGPASLRDFAWWSGLTLTDAKRAAEALGPELLQDGNLRFFESNLPGGKVSGRAWLLPNFDEYIVAYTERGDFFDPSHDAGLIPRNSMLSRHSIVIGGRVAGTWKRELGKDAVRVELSPFASLTRAQAREVHVAAEHYASFLGLALVLQ